MQPGGRRFDPGWLHSYKLLAPLVLRPSSTVLRLRQTHWSGRRGDLSITRMAVQGRPQTIGSPAREFRSWPGHSVPTYWAEDTTAVDLGPSSSACAQPQIPFVRPRWRITLHDMKTSALTIRLDRDLERRLNRAAKRSGRTRSEFVRDALKRQLAVAQLEDLRRRIMPFAEAQGYLTDEDVFRDVS